LCVYRELSSRHFLSFSSSFPLGINDEPKVSLMQSGDYVQLGLTGYMPPQKDFLHVVVHQL
ncbi:MAG TPA: hypothetical protein QGI39_08545, partial [Gammaproteobacteria bacterium]|nr:hypothetical protein [Gammaproteobacteria bacterium]